MAAGGFSALLRSKQPKLRLSPEESTQRALQKLIGKYGEDKTTKMKDEFKTSSKHQQDGMIVTLLTKGAPQASIRGLFEVGGYRINRLSQCMGMTAE